MRRRGRKPTDERKSIKELRNGGGIGCHHRNFRTPETCVVFYTEKLPDALEIIKNFNFDNLPKTLFERILISKLKDWEYEREWRLILDCRKIISENEKVSDDYWNTGKIEWLAKPSKVYLGVKINQEMKSLIVDICRRLDISVYQMECTEYGLKEVLTK